MPILYLHQIRNLFVILSDAQIFWDLEAMVSSQPEINWQHLMEKRVYPS